MKYKLLQNDNKILYLLKDTYNDQAGALIIRQDLSTLMIRQELYRSHFHFIIFHFCVIIIIITVIHCNFRKLFAVCNFGHFILISFLCCMFVLEMKDE